MACCRSEAAVARQQWFGESLGKRDVHAVVGCHVVSKFPDSGQQKEMRMPSNRKFSQIDDRTTTPIAVDDTIRLVSAQNMGDFDIEQVGAVQRLRRGLKPPADGVRCWGAKQHLDQRRRIDHHYGRSRSARITSAG